MKGVIRKINPKANILDLTHSIKPHNVIEGAWVLYKSYKYFPSKTVFCVVVDPGVGTDRQPVAVKTRNYYFVGPDNGVLWQSCVADTIQEVIQLSIENSSTTFHGRDIFAPFVAEIKLSNVKFTDLGQSTSLNVQLSLMPETPNKGKIVRIDHFGNIITNLSIPKSSGSLIIVLGNNNQTIKAEINRTFSDGPSDIPFAVLGSSDTLEIVLRNNRAVDLLNVKIGDSVTIQD